MEFPNCQIFRAAISQYAVCQRRNLTVNISDKAGSKLRAVCKDGCPFSVYGSLDKKTSSFVVKTVNPKHTCVRTMGTNKQLTSS